MVEFVIGAPQDLLSICGYWFKKYHCSPGLAVLVISALSVLKNTYDTLSLNLFTLDLIILSALSTREFYSLAYIT